MSRRNPPWQQTKTGRCREGIESIVVGGLSSIILGNPCSIIPSRSDKSSQMCEYLTAISAIHSLCHSAARNPLIAQSQGIFSRIPLCSFVSFVGKAFDFPIPAMSPLAIISSWAAPAPTASASSPASSSAAPWTISGTGRRFAHACPTATCPPDELGCRRTAGSS